MTTAALPPPSGAKPKNTDFFTGYGKKLPEKLRVFVPAAAGILIALFALTGLASGLLQASPGDGRFRWDLGPITLVGLLDMHPAPVVHAQPTERYPKGHSMMLTGQGKVGVQKTAASLHGRLVEVKGFITQRGALDMLVVDALKAAETSGDSGAGPSLPQVVDLGRWRLTGEICDGKCVSGAMRPGRGISHKACANLCIIGGAPPVFVADGAVDGAGFFLVADLAGRPVADQLVDYTAVPVQVEGRIERRGDIAVLLIDISRIKRL